MAFVTVPTLRAAKSTPGAAAPKASRSVRRFVDPTIAKDSDRCPFLSSGTRASAAVRLSFGVKNHLNLNRYSEL
jgi:hypothetical protein